MILSSFTLYQCPKPSMISLQCDFRAVISLAKQMSQEMCSKYLTSHRFGMKGKEINKDFLFCKELRTAITANDSFGWISSGWVHENMKYSGSVALECALIEWWQWQARKQVFCSASKLFLPVLFQQTALRFASKSVESFLHDVLDSSVKVVNIV